MVVYGTVLQKKQPIFWLSLVLLAGLLKFADLVLVLIFTVDSFLYTDKLLKENSNTIPNRMAPVTAVCFVLAGISLAVNVLHEKAKTKTFPLCGIG